MQIYTQKSTQACLFDDELPLCLDALCSLRFLLDPQQRLETHKLVHSPQPNKRYTTTHNNQCVARLYIFSLHEKVIKSKENADEGKDLNQDSEIVPGRYAKS